MTIGIREVKEIHVPSVQEREHDTAIQPGQKWRAFVILALQEGEEVDFFSKEKYSNN